GRRGTRTVGRRSESLRRRLRGDLDTIVMKALHKDPARRYPSAAAFLEDLRRHRGGHPVLARPDSAAYRTGKFVSRHRIGVATGALLVLAAIGVFVREGQLRRRAEANAARAAAVSDYLVGVFEVSDPLGTGAEHGEDVTARTLLDRGAASIEADLADQPETQAEMLGVLGRVYMNLGLMAEAEGLLERSLERRRELYGRISPEISDALEALGDLYIEQGRLGEAQETIEQALAMRRRLFGSEHASTARSLDRLATVHQEKSEYSEAEPLFREALAIRERLLGPEHSSV